MTQIAISRQRMCGADATGAEPLGDPLPLADAFEGLHRGASAIPKRVTPAADPLGGVTALRADARGGAMHLFSTNPPMEERVARLRRMSGARAVALPTL